MRAIDQFSKFCATFADRLAWARPLSGPDSEDREHHEQGALPPDDKRAAPTMQIDRDDEKHAQPPRGPYPAVWPR